MAIGSVVNTGVQGFQRAVAGVERSAQQIAGVAAEQNITEEGGDLIAPLVEMKLYELNAKASAKVVETGDKVLGTLLDIKA